MKDQNTLDFSPYETRNLADNPIADFLGGVLYQMIHLGSLSVEVFLARDLGARYLRKRHLILVGLNWVIVLTLLWYLGVSGAFWATVFFLASMSAGVVHVTRGWRSECAGKPCWTHTRSSGKRFCVALARRLGWPAGAAWVRRVYEPAAVAALAVPVWYLSPPLAVSLILVGFFLSLKAEVLYARWLSASRDIADAEAMARAIAGQRQPHEQQEYYEVVLVAPVPPLTPVPQATEAVPPPTPVPQATGAAPSPDLRGRIRGRCIQCQAKITLAPGLAGKRVRCPKCKARFRVPAAAAADCRAS